MKCCPKNLIETEPFGTRECINQGSDAELKKGRISKYIWPYLCTGWKVWSNGTTSVLKSIPRLVLAKVRQVLVSVDLNFNVLIQNVPNKSLLQELLAGF